MSRPGFPAAPVVGLVGGNSATERETTAGGHEP